MGTPGSWKVFLPGVIPGLPSSPTIIGTVEDILNAPGEVLSDLWKQVEARVQDPVGYLEDILNGALDEDGLVTVGGIATVVNEIIDDLFDGDANNVDPTTGEQTGDGTSVGGAGEDTNTNEELNLSDRGGNDQVIYGDPNEEEQVLGGAGGDTVVEEGGGGGGGRRVASPKSGQDYMYRLQYNPDAPMSVPGMMGGSLGQQAPRRRVPELGKPTMVEGLLTSFGRV